MLETKCVSDHFMFLQLRMTSIGLSLMASIFDCPDVPTFAESVTVLLSGQFNQASLNCPLNTPRREGVLGVDHGHVSVSSERSNTRAGKGVVFKINSCSLLCMKPPDKF